ncbi:hypothetical protein Pelo_15455 [Pelomyxa schiedti]|nr:hypothetical protein Pelo_15455 [Pelomyxa schiedti]
MNGSLRGVVLLLSLVVSYVSSTYLGVCIIRDEPKFYDFEYPEMVQMRADVVKFQLSYDNEWGWPSTFDVPYQHVDTAIYSLGAKVIIFRSADTKTASSQIWHFVNEMTFSNGQTLVSYIASHSTTQFIIEVGNEPDLNGLDPWIARWNYLDTAKNCIPSFRYLSNLQWIASMPTKTGNSNYPGQSYTDVIYTTDADGSVQSYYDGLGTHAYGYWSLDQSDGADPMWPTNQALSHLPSGKSIWVSECGINSPDSWGTKGNYFVNAYRSGDKRIAGWTIFTLSNDASWNSNGLYYDIDIDYSNQQPVSGMPCATALAKR